MGLEPRSLFATGITMRNSILSFGAAVVLLFALAPGASSQSPQQDSNQSPAPPSGEMPKGPDGSTRGQQGRGRGLFGKISALQSDSIEVTRPDGTKISIKLTASTEFRKEREAAKFSDFKVGDNVIVRTNQEGADAAGATAVMVASVPAGFAGRGGPGGPGGMPGTQGKDFVMGEVKSLDPPKITVLRVDNVADCGIERRHFFAQRPRQYHHGRYSAGGLRNRQRSTCERRFCSQDAECRSARNVEANAGNDERSRARRSSVSQKRPNSSGTASSSGETQLNGFFRGLIVLLALDRK